MTSRLGKDTFRVEEKVGISGDNLNLVDVLIKLLIKWMECNFSELSTKYIKPWAGLRLIDQI